MNTSLLYTGQSPFIVANGLVSYWSFNEGRGDIVRDYGPDANHGAGVSSLIYIDGKIGKGMYFNGTDQVINVQPGSLFALSSAANWSVSLWCNNIGPIGDYGGWFVFNNVGIVKETVNRVAVISGDTIVLNTATNVATSSVWQHFVATKTAGVYGIYVAGTNASGAFISDSGYGYGSKYSIGRGYSVARMNCIIDEVRVYNRGLTPSEITTLYNAGHP